MHRHTGGGHVVTRPGTAYVCAIHEGETMNDALARFDRDRLWVERELGDVPHDRVIGANCHDNPMLWTTMDGNVQGYADRVEFWDAGDGAGLELNQVEYRVPVESLGRDA